MPLFSIINLAFGIYDDDMLPSPLLNVEKKNLRKYFYPFDLHIHKKK